MPSPKEASHIKTLQFVDARSLGDARTQGLVRSHVILEFGCQQRWHERRGRDQGIEASMPMYGAADHEQHNQDDIEDSSCARPISILGARRIDPFSCSRTSALADHCGFSSDQAFSTPAYTIISSTREAIL